jgi:hypothetical protein
MGKAADLNVFRFKNTFILLENPVQMDYHGFIEGKWAKRDR